MICFRCTVETKEQLDHLLATGTYKDYGEVIAAAVRNQALMEQELAANGAIVISALSPVTRPPDVPNDRDKQESSVKPPPNSNPPAKQEASTPAIPPLFKQESLPEDLTTGLAGLPADMWSLGQAIPLDRWVLGQFNRLLPAKANARALIHLFQEQPGGLPIKETAERIAAEAAVLGDYLSFLDERTGIGRDDALSTAFPTTAGDADKARVRYANQFVAYQNTRGELSGLMVDLKFINVVARRKERVIVPTRVAWEFARLRNPVLDGTANGVAEKFSSEERSLLLRHIVSSVPVEAFAYRAILEAVQGGDNTPDTIDAALKKSYVTEDRAGKLSQSFLASQRSGAISRMSDLGLIERQREGVRVSYAMTEEGRAFLAQCVAAKQ